MAINVPTIVLLAFAVNIAAGLVIVSVVDINGDPVFDLSDTAGLTIDEHEEYEQGLVTEMEKDIQPSGEVSNAADQIYRVLDLIGLGFIYKFILFVDTYLFGFVNMIDSVIGHMLTPETHLILFGSSIRYGALKLILTISYILYGITLYTGRSVVSETS